MYLTVVLAMTSNHLNDVAGCLKSMRQHNVEVLASTSSREEVSDLIQMHRPDVVIMDPSIDDGRMVREWAQRFGATPVLLCASEIDDYAVDAFNARAAHYVTLPVEQVHIDEAIRRAVARIVRYDQDGGNGNTANETRAPFNCKVIALPSIDGIEIRNHGDLFSAHGEGNYTRVMLKADPPMLLSRTLKDVEPSLQQAGLLRVHRSHMVNPDQIRRVRRGKSPVVELANGEQVDVSERYKEFLYAMLQIRTRR